MKKILMIDDDRATSISLVELLNEDDKFDLTYSEDPAESLNLVSNNHYDAIILDIMMPVPNSWTYNEKSKSEGGLSTGIVLFEKIRELKPKIPVLILSAKESTRIDKYSSYLRKPESILTIIQSLIKLINGKA